MHLYFLTTAFFVALVNPICAMENFPCKIDRCKLRDVSIQQNI